MKRIQNTFMVIITFVHAKYLLNVCEYYQTDISIVFQHYKKKKNNSNKTTPQVCNTCKRTQRNKRIHICMPIHTIVVTCVWMAKNSNTTINATKKKKLCIV